MCSNFDLDNFWIPWRNPFVIPFVFQELARAKGPGGDILCTLDVHALDELKVKGYLQTDDRYKYDYSKNEEGEYGK